VSSGADPLAGERVTIPCEYWHAASEQCRVHRYICEAVSETILGAGCRREIAIDPTRENVCTCPMRRLAEGEAFPLEDIIHVPQTPETGLGAMIGKWPGDETDEEIREALDALS
jgi:hypothetical protein